jgi:hypothetical protein
MVRLVDRFDFCRDYLFILTQLVAEAARPTGELYNQVYIDDQPSPLTSTNQSAFGVLCRWEII